MLGKQVYMSTTTYCTIVLLKNHMNIMKIWCYVAAVVQQLRTRSEWCKKHDTDVVFLLDFFSPSECKKICILISNEILHNLVLVIGSSQY